MGQVVGEGRETNITIGRAQLKLTHDIYKMYTRIDLRMN